MQGLLVSTARCIFLCEGHPPGASLLSRSDVLAQLSRSEGQKKRAYPRRVIDVERGTFTPLDFATNGMRASECSRPALKSIVQLIVEKQPEQYKM